MNKGLITTAVIAFCSVHRYLPTVAKYHQKRSADRFLNNEQIHE